MSILKKLLITIILANQFASLQADELDISQNLEFQHISTGDGLSQKTVQSIFQDSYGFMWIGTQEGLNRYDGKEIIIYRNDIDDNTSLSSNVITDILEDNQKKLWIATGSGLNQLTSSNKKFIHIPIIDKSNNSILRLNTLFNDNGTILVGTDGHGIYSIDTNNKNYLAKSMSNLEPLNDTDVRVIFKDSRKRIWIGTDGNGVWLVDKRGQISENFTVEGNNSNSISHNRIRAITEDSKGQIWIGTRGGGLSRFNELNKNFTRYMHEKDNLNSLSNNRVYKILEDINNNLWIATDGGVNLYNRESGQFSHLRHQSSQISGLSHNRVLSIFQDKGGLIWLGTLSGLNIWNPITAKFKHYQNISEDNNSLSNNTVFGIEEDDGGSLYVATFGGGLNYLSATKNGWSIIKNDNDGKPLKLDSRLMSLMVDNKKQLWVGSFSKGITVLSKNNKLINHFEHDPQSSTSLSANGITDILQDSDDEIWVATYSAGINRLNKKENNFERYGVDEKNENSPKSNNVLQMLEDDEGYIWLATHGGGISRLDKNTGSFKNFIHDKKNKSSLSGDAVMSIYQDSIGRFWIGTQGRGLNRWEPDDRRQGKNNFKHYTIKNGLPSSSVNGVLEDEDGFIWVSTNKGISKLNPKTNDFTHYNLALEIHDNELNQGSMLRAKGGQLFFGGLNGISYFNPNEVTTNKNKPTVVITNIISGNKPLELEQSFNEFKELTFSHSDYLIRFEFAALDYAQPENNQYQYKLEGFDRDWISLKNKNSATYTNLPSGRYLFKVKASNNDGVWSDELINLTVLIKPAVWATWWAYTIYFALFCMMIIYFIRTQAKKIANQDVFVKKIKDSINSSASNYKNENKFLKEQLENYEYISGYDLATGLPNQKYFTDQLNVSLRLLKLCHDKSRDLKIGCFYISLTKMSINESYIRALTEKIVKLDNSVLLIAKWNINEIALLTSSLSRTEFMITANKFIAITKEVFLENPNSYSNSNSPQYITPSIGLTATPLRNDDPNSFKWEMVSLLTEHMMKCAEKSESSNVIGLIESHQKVEQIIINDVIGTQDISKHQEYFKIEIAN